MTSQLSDSIWQILACPHCGARLAHAAEGASCAECGRSFPQLANNQLDLRLQAPKVAQVSFELGTALLPEAGFAFDSLAANPQPALDLEQVRIPWHLTRTLVSHFPKASQAGARMLDLGCGEGIHKEIGEAFGYEWVGLDYGIPAAPIKGDAHALPFLDVSFEFILSIAVLEHIQFPFVMTQEAFRVLQPGRLFIGTVSFLEPFHHDSYYHHSHLAAYNSLRNAGFEVLQIAPSVDWPALLAIGNMALFRQLPMWITRVLVAPLQWLHRLWWALGYAVTGAERASEHYRRLSTAGAFTFIARKPLGWKD